MSFDSVDAGHVRSSKSPVKSSKYTILPEDLHGKTSTPSGDLFT